MGLKLISSCTTKDTIYTMKRQPTEWEKIFADDETDKELISQIYHLLIERSLSLSIYIYVYMYI